jgi:hypothetical protein
VNLSGFTSRSAKEPVKLFQVESKERCCCSNRNSGGCSQHLPFACPRLFGRTLQFCQPGLRVFNLDGLCRMVKNYICGNPFGRPR